MNQDHYLEELRQRLSFRGASRRQGKDIVAEVQSHLAESGEDPVDAFGRPDEYAERVLRGYRWPTARLMALMLFSVMGASLLVRSVNAVRRGEEVVSVQTAEVLFWVVFSLAVPFSMMPAVHRRLAGRRTFGLLVIVVVSLAGGSASYLGSLLFGEDARVTSGPWVLLAVGMGLLAAAALVATVWRRLRRRQPA